MFPRRLLTPPFLIGFLAILIVIAGVGWMAYSSNAPSVLSSDESSSSTAIETSASTKIDPHPAPIHLYCIFPPKKNALGQILADAVSPHFTVDFGSHNVTQCDETESCRTDAFTSSDLPTQKTSVPLIFAVAGLPKIEVSLMGFTETTVKGAAESGHCYLTTAQ